jgi:hypothetical protein
MKWVLRPIRAVLCLPVLLFAIVGDFLGATLASKYEIKEGFVADILGVIWKGIS